MFECIFVSVIGRIYQMEFLCKCIMKFIKKRVRNAGIEKPLQKRFTLLLALLSFIFIFVCICCLYVSSLFNLILFFFDNRSLPLGIATGHPRFRAWSLDKAILCRTCLSASVIWSRQKGLSSTLRPLRLAHVQ